MNLPAMLAHLETVGCGMCGPLASTLRKLREEGGYAVGTVTTFYPELVRFASPAHEKGKFYLRIPLGELEDMVRFQAKTARNLRLVGAI